MGEDFENPYNQAKGGASARVRAFTDEMQGISTPPLDPNPETEKTRPYKVPPYIKRTVGTDPNARKGLLPGRGIETTVADQVRKRQELIKAKNRLFSEDNSQVAFNFFNRKTPFIRLTSGIDVNGSATSAEEHVLSNGLHYSKDDLFNGYQTGGGHDSVGSKEDFGLRPAAGITGMTLNTHNRYGSLRTATVQFEVHTLEQIDRYEELFMRPGYSALLEWGHSVYISNDDTDKEVYEIPTLLSDSFLEGTIATSHLEDQDAANNEKKLTIYRAIARLREKYGYSYDGMYGLIKNFSWTLRPDGGYSCTADIVSIGTVIESLAIDSGVTAIDFRKYANIDPILPQLDTPQSDTQEEGAPPFSEELKIYMDAVEKLFTSPVDFPEGISKPQPYNAPRTDNPISEIRPKSIVPMELYAIPEKRMQKVYMKNEMKEIPPTGYPIEVVYTSLSAVIVRSSLETYDSVIVKDYEKDPIFNIFNDRSIIVNFKDRGSKEVKETTFRLVFEKEELKKLKYRDYTEEGYKMGEPTWTDKEVWEFSFRFELEKEEILEFVDEEGNNFVPEDLSVINNTLEDFLRDFHPYFTSQIHLILHLIELKIDSKIDRNVDEPEKTKIYQEIPYDTKGLDYSPFIDSDYRVTAVRRVLGKDTTNKFYHYVQLGTLLDILNTFIPVSGTEPLFQFHTYKTEPHAYKTLENIHASVQLDKFILPNSYASSDIKRGDILDIFVELDYVRGLLGKSLSTGELKSYDLVTEILENLTIATGKINEFGLQYDEDNFTFHVVDRALVGDTQTDHLVLKLIGRDTILRNISMNSKLSPGISTQIAIAAQSNPSSGGVEGTLFERFNKNLKDRYIVEKKQPRDIEKETSTKEEKRKQLLSKLSTAFNFLRHAYGEPEYINQQVDLPNVTSQYVVLCSEEKTLEPEKRRYGGILPFEITLELDGISGLQVMDGFRINQAILPKSYVGDGRFGFLITGLTHKVDSNGWVVEVKSQIYNMPSEAGAASAGQLRMVPLPEDTRIKHPMYGGPSPNADRVRAILDSLGYKERSFVGGKKDSRGVTGYLQKELSSGGDIHPGLADKAIEVFREIKEKFPNMGIEVTAGKDHYHHVYNVNSPHNSGLAIDFIVTGGSSKEAADFIRNLDNKDNFLGFKDEYANHVAHTTGNHFHITYDPSGQS